MNTWMTSPGSATLWCVGFLPDGTELPVSHHDVEQDTLAAQSTLASLGVAADAHVLLLSTLPQVSVVWPFAAAMARSGGAVYFADSTVFDASRTEMFTRRVPVDAVLGLNRDVVKGLSELGDPYEVLRRARVVAATPDLVPELRAEGVNAVRWVQVGPALAVDCNHGRLHHDDTQWTLTTSAQGTSVVPASSRAATGTVYTSDLTLTVLFDVCGCGLVGGLVLEQSA